MGIRYIPLYNNPSYSRILIASCLYRVINVQEDLSSFQSDIDKVSAWYEMNKMTINTKRCRVMRITRKKSPLVQEYNIEGRPLECVNVYKKI